MSNDKLTCDKHPVALAEAVCVECLLDLEEQLETLERLHDEAVARFDAERGRREELERIVASNPASEPLS